MTLLVRKPGLWTTVQDGGRRGWQRYGVPVGGPMDAASFAAANALVGNGDDAAALELTLTGGTYEAAADLSIAVCGADLSPTVDGAPLPMWRPVDVPAGSELRFGSASVGRYAYLAVAGGFRTAVALGSRSTAPRDALPGADGRPLSAGDALPTAPVAASRRPRGPYEAASWYLGEPWRFSGPAVAGERVVRAMPGAEWERFDAETRRTIEAGEWTCVVRAESDRMGYRLRPSRPPQAAGGTSLLSSAVTFGTVQVPPDGQPIALMADRQTTGGYPRLLQIAAVDAGCLAQARPGDVVRIRLIAPEEASAVWIERMRRLRWLRDRVRWAERERNR
ncbi:biotin-dependent carboxyltransferase family protein [Paenibacillus antri]|uniref:Biotin-dependent carboxyltransferase family protein n=1 Tax=Paenibacillus antri TaxID=2582848 RepID=A0A5R9G965_9BACL|nr:biotin-dependent carboxyltransferase family protein [Paenibacillus antri]TLS52962.1 biotin-dependent carboxyltransferase family protein [Paenibacillus antri]